MECGFDPDICIEDMKGNRAHILLAGRDEAIRQTVKAGATVPAVAECLGLSKRVVWRVVAR